MRSDVYRLTLPAFGPAVIQPPNLIPNPKKASPTPFRGGHRSGIIHARRKQEQFVSAQQPPLGLKTSFLSGAFVFAKASHKKLGKKNRSQSTVDEWKNENIWGFPSSKSHLHLPPLACHKDQWNWMWACQQDNAGQSPFISIRQQDW